MDVSVIIGTFGDPEWQQLADRAAASAEDQADEVICVHGDTLAQARNEGLRMAGGEYVIHLDADDTLEPGYVGHLLTGTADLRAPAVRYVTETGHARSAHVPKVAGHTHDCTGDCLPFGNWLVVGTMVRAQLLKDVGGWEEWPIYEDWAAFARCWVAGGTVEAIPAAVYRATWRPGSRNRAPDHRFKDRVHHEIAAAVFPEAPAVA